MRRILSVAMSVGAMLAGCASVCEVAMHQPPRPRVEPGHQRMMVGGWYSANGSLVMKSPGIIEVERADVDETLSQSFACLVASSDGQAEVAAPSITNSEAELVLEDTEEAMAVATGTRPRVRTNRITATSYGTTLLMQSGKGVQRLLVWDLKPGAPPVDVWVLDANGKPDPASVVKLGNMEMAEHQPGAKTLTKRAFTKGEGGVVGKLLSDAKANASRTGFKFPEPGSNAGGRPNADNPRRDEGGGA